MARLCFNARGDIGSGRGIVINADDATIKMLHLRVVTAASTATAAHAALQKP